MFTPELTQSKIDYFDHHVPSLITNKTPNSLVSSTFLSPTPSNYSDSGSYQQSPLSIYNNYNPNYHHHHYYFHPNFPDYGYNQPQAGNYLESGSSWMRKYDYENQKEYFIANTPPPTECYDFEVPQRVEQSPKPTAMKLFNDIDKIFFDDQSSCKSRDQMTISSVPNEPCESYNFWENEFLCSAKVSKKNVKSREKLKRDNSGMKICNNSEIIAQKGLYILYLRRINIRFLNCFLVTIEDI